MPFPSRQGHPHYFQTRKPRCPASWFGRLLAAVAFTTTLASSHTMAATAPAVRNIVLVHGAFADGS
ncbi:alpha/beta hydrolase, partial [Burkholderia cenocepacia]|nr:alpha/beta hydrolase [Burkholderia cenocepacia]